MKKYLKSFMSITFLFIFIKSYAQQFPPPLWIYPQGKPEIQEEDYFSVYLNKPVNFAHKDSFGRIAGFGPGIKEKSVSDGTLHFTTGEKDNFFYFGRWLYPKKEKQEIPDENIGFRWNRAIVSTKLKMRIRQSLPESTWSLGIRGTYGNPGNVPGRVCWITKNKKLAGTDWQYLVLPFYFDRDRSIRAICVKTNEKANQVEIDDIKIVKEFIPLFYRRTFQLDSKVVQARIRLNVPMNHQVYINGKKVQNYFGYLNVGVNPMIDIKDHLHKGKNVIAVGIPNSITAFRAKAKLKNDCVCEGLVLTENGEFINLNSNTSWKGSFKLFKDWNKRDFDDLNWKNVKVGSDTKYWGQVNYVGPFWLNDEEPIFKLDKGIKLTWLFPKGYSIAYQLINSFTEQTDSEGVLSKVSKTKTLDHHTLIYKTRKPGVWLLKLALKKEDKAENIKNKSKPPETVAERKLEIAVVGPFKQKLVNGNSFTEGMKLIKIAEIDCTKEDAGYRRYEFSAVRQTSQPSRVAKTSIGTYRETGDLAYRGFGYLFEVENLYKPHLIEVEYPDDQERLMMVKVFCGRNKTALSEPEKYQWNWFMEQRWYSGVKTGGEEFSVSGKFKKLYLLFWPDGDKKINTVQIMTEKKGLKAAARNIKIYEIDDLPALKVPNTPNRLYGMFVEREKICPNNFYSGKFSKRFKLYDTPYEDNIGRIRDWYDTTQNLIKYMRFAGQNLYVPGYFMYQSVFFPEIMGQHKRNRIPTDHLRLMAAMFEQNDLYLIIGAQYFVSLSALEKQFPTNWEMKNESKETVLGVCADGRQALHSGSAGTGAMDYQNKFVKEDLQAFVESCLKYSANYKTVLGIDFYSAYLGFPSTPVIQLARTKEISNSALSWQLTNRNIKEFSEMTGLRLPGKIKDPNRHMKRYHYLLDNPEIQSRWIDFISSKVYNHIREMLEQIHKKRPDWKLYLQPAGLCTNDREDFLRGEMSLDEGLKRRGFDFNRYRNLAVVNNLATILKYRGMTGLKPGETLPEDRGNMLYPVNRPPVPAHTQAVVPTEPYAAKDFVLGMAYLTPSIIMFTKADVMLLTGGEQRLRPFVRKFRSLPVGEYQTLTGRGLNKNIVIRKLKSDDQNVFYVVNPSKWNVKVDIVFNDDDTKIYDNVTNTLKTKGKTLSLSLLPYDFLVFKVEPSSAVPMSATSAISTEGIKEITKLIESALQGQPKLEEAKNVSELSKNNTRKSFVKQDFEQPLNGWNVTDPQAIKRVSTGAWIENSLMIQAENKPVTVTKTFNSLKPERIYTMSFFARLAENSNAEVALRSDKYGIVATRAKCVITDDSDGVKWRFYEMKFIAPESTSKDVRLEITVENGTFFIDDIKLKLKNKGLIGKKFLELQEQIKKTFQDKDYLTAYNLVKCEQFKFLYDLLKEN